MNTTEIIGRTIIDIFVWSKMDVDGLDEAEVSIQLDNGKLIGIPWSFESEKIEKELKPDSESLFLDLSDIPVHSINPERKTIQEVLDAKKKRESSLIGRLKKAVGLGEGIPREYKVYKTEYRENKLKYLKNQKIKDFLMFDDSDSVGYIELENGYIITETIMSPQGTGAAGLKYYSNLESFEESWGTEYKRLKNKNQ
ncbi:hypothetical protein H8K90_10430 [Winogradskyella echinorum]|uniref:Uncharacterized protein n=1 Tax=Winogradskyella echinorum TaxID=538189 RepID=A0ABR6Y234_9FLAO|nr:hypothetical protein [Winogradskyella echinorum]MBC3846796.1 hypothetical protein [Winogradskyella echinorum]MBC5751144.1 hypothetical protein [Winogradskyella echinorum]